MDIEPQTIPEKKEPGFSGARRIFDTSGIALRKRRIETKNFREGQGWSLGQFSARFNHVISRNDSSVSYVGGTWTDQTVSINYYSGRRQSATVGDYFEITFTGNYIGVFLTLAGDQGKVNISIDGDTATLVDLYSTALRERYIAYESSGLSNGRHILKATVATKNDSSSANGVNFQGYTLNQDVALKLQNLSCEIYTYATNQLTDANGFKEFAISAPSGYTVFHIVGLRLAESVMSDATLTDPKLAWRTTECYLYNGAVATTYTVSVTLLISKN